MVFSSISFLFYFLPCVILLYFISPRRLRNAILAVSSLIFYAWGEPRYILIMLFSTVVDYTCGKLIAREQSKGKSGKVFLIASIVINLSVLGFFKYYNFLAGNIMALFGMSNVGLLDITLPIGISFYTFQTMSYTIDVYRKNVGAQKSIINFATFVTLFPQLIAGPIVKYTDIAEELDNENRGSADMFSEGVARFIAGLGKKVLLANNIGILWDTVQSTPIAEMSVLYAWLGIIAFAFQIYFDFSGYSDMAIGLGKMFGLTFPENFNYPYISQSITEFWRRWHMTLGSWFREYVYIPLGGNRVNVPKHIRNILVVWLLTGIWHGANWNFLLWGVYYGVILLIEKLFLQNILRKLPRVFRHVYSILFILLGWVLFAFEDMTTGVAYLKIMFGNASFVNQKAIFDFLSYLPMLIILGVLSTPIKDKIMKIGFFKKIAPVVVPVMAIAVLLLSVAYLVESGYNPFLYFRF
ncbi:MAG: MBOAT family protein [Clostridia bacterium]|nr:MBOAT family protein [Clostridia bacterium]